jgi:hypothetical protein
MADTFKIFHGPHFEHITKDLFNKLKSEVSETYSDSLDSTESEKFVESLISKYRIQPLVLTFDAVAISHHQLDIPAESFPPGFAVEDGGVYRRSVIRYHVPFQGDEFLLQCKPKPCAMDTFDAFVEDGCVCFDIVVFHSSEPERVRDTAGGRLKAMREQHDALAIQVESFNRGLSGMGRVLCDLKAWELEGRSAFLEALGYPLRKKDERIPSANRRETNHPAT